LAVAMGSGLWGLFWIPLRYLDGAGIGSLWSVALVMSLSTIPAWFLTVRRNELSAMRELDAWLIGIALGTSTVLYFLGMIYSDVIRVIFLFYLLPIWTLLAARLIYGEPITPPRLLMIAITLTGLWLLLGGGTTSVWPTNIGDWCAIGAGACWGTSLALLRGRKDIPPFALVAVLFGMAALYPAMLGQVWGARRIPAPTAALLTMTEIIVATASAMLLIGSDLTAVAWLGGMMNLSINGA